MPEMLGRVGLDVIEVIAAMPRCRDCRWWNGTNRPAICMKIRGRANVDGLPVGGAMIATIRLPSDSEALITDPEFGCVQFEGKPDA